MEHGILRCYRLIAIFTAKSSSVAVCRREQDDRRSGRDVDGVDTIYKIWISTTVDNGRCDAEKQGSTSCRRGR